jgi:hypothetical protein
MQKNQDQPATDEQIAQMRKATETCFEINDIERKITYVSNDKCSFVCVMEARDVESARRALESAGIDYERIWAATSF